MSDERPCCDCPVEAQRREDEAKCKWYARAREIHQENIAEARDKQLEREGHGWRAWLRAHGMRGPAEHYAERAAQKYDRSAITVPFLMGNGVRTHLTRDRGMYP